MKPKPDCPYAFYLPKGKHRRREGEWRCSRVHLAVNIWELSEFIGDIMRRGTGCKCDMAAGAQRQVHNHIATDTKHDE